MNRELEKDLTQLASLLELAKVNGLDFLNQLSDRFTSTIYSLNPATELNETGLGASKALDTFKSNLEPLIVGSSGPRYWGFVTGGATPASIIGDMLATFYDQNTQSVSGQGDVSALIEIETINLLLDLLGLPKDFFGGFVTGATMSNFTSLAVARQWVGKQQGIDIAKNGITTKIPIFSASPHSSAIKSLSMLGIGSNNVELIKILPGNREAMDTNDLAEKLSQLDNQPSIVIASAGTVNTVDFDDFNALLELKKQYNFWLHIDAAFGAFAACSPQHKYLLNGWEAADSITVDCHKWLNVPYENAFFLVKKEHRICQVETFQNSNAPYLGDPLDKFTYLNFLPENSRRLKALPVWFTLKAYGKNGYREIVENSIRMAQLFSNYVESKNELQLLAPTRLNNVAFTIKNKEAAEFLSAINATGKVFMTPTVYKGAKGIRASFVNWRTNENDISIVTDEIDKLLTV